MRLGRTHQRLVLIAFMATALGLAPKDEAGELTGSWSWSWKDSAGVVHKHVLEVEGSGDKLSARERFDELEPVKVTDLKLAEKKVTFTVRREKHQAAYTGTMKSKDLIEGLVNISTDGQANEYSWEARRQTPKKP